MPVDWLKRTVCLITGASQGIGSHVARLMASKLGSESLLILTSRSIDRLQNLRDSVFPKNPGLAVHLFQWDFGKPDAEVIRRDLINCCVQDAGIVPARFQQAIVVHNAAALGDMRRKVSEMSDASELRTQLDLNLVSMLVLNSVFLSLFAEAPKRVVVNMTAPSAEKPRSSFGLTSMVKSSRQIVLSILAKEEPDVKVLHFDPVAVDTESLRAIRDSSHDSEIRAWIQGFYDRQEVLPAEAVAEALCAIVEADSYETGAVLNALQRP